MSVSFPKTKHHETVDVVGWLQSSWFLPHFSMILAPICSNVFQHFWRWVNFPRIQRCETHRADQATWNKGDPKKMPTMHVFYFEPCYAFGHETMFKKHVHACSYLLVLFSKSWRKTYSPYSLLMTWIKWMSVDKLRPSNAHIQQCKMYLWQHWIEANRTTCMFV